MLKHRRLLDLGKQSGIHKLGVSQADAIQLDQLDEWLNRGYQGQMTYMERNREKRLDPGKLLNGARSVISVFVNYHQEKSSAALEGVVSKYARSRDYHLILKDLLHELAGQLFADRLKGLSRSERNQMFRIFVDSAPVLEKYWAVRAGIGWQGKHSNIITKEFGSWGFLGEIITTEAFDHYDLPVPDHCGTCTACIEACPTKAIVEPYQVDGSRCISYATIELSPEQSIPGEIRKDMDQWIFGCDICQDVCPWNRFANPSEIAAFNPVDGFRSGEIPDFQQMNEEDFSRLFGMTPLERAGLKGMQRNQAKGA